MQRHLDTEGIVETISVAIVWRYVSHYQIAFVCWISARLRAGIKKGVHHVKGFTDILALAGLFPRCESECRC